jgi:hypothetical protein
MTRETVITVISGLIASLKTAFWPVPSISPRPIRPRRTFTFVRYLAIIV